MKLNSQSCLPTARFRLLTPSKKKRRSICHSARKTLTALSPARLASDKATDTKRLVCDNPKYKTPIHLQASADLLPDTFPAETHQRMGNSGTHLLVSALELILPLHTRKAGPTVSGFTWLTGDQALTTTAGASIVLLVAALAVSPGNDAVGRPALVRIKRSIVSAMFWFVRKNSLPASRP